MKNNHYVETPINLSLTSVYNVNPRKRKNRNEPILIEKTASPKKVKIGVTETLSTPSAELTIISAINVQHQIFNPEEVKHDLIINNEQKNEMDIDSNNSLFLPECKSVLNKKNKEKSKVNRKTKKTCNEFIYVSFNEFNQKDRDILNLLLREVDINKRFPDTEFVIAQLNNKNFIIFNEDILHCQGKFKQAIRSYLQEFRNFNQLKNKLKESGIYHETNIENISKEFFGVTKSGLLKQIKVPAGKYALPGESCDTLISINTYNKRKKRLEPLNPISQQDPISEIQKKILLSALEKSSKEDLRLSQIRNALCIPSGSYSGYLSELRKRAALRGNNNFDSLMVLFRYDCEIFEKFKTLNLMQQKIITKWLSFKGNVAGHECAEEKSELIYQNSMSSISGSSILPFSNITLFDSLNQPSTTSSVSNKVVDRPIDELGVNETSFNRQYNNNVGDENPGAYFPPYFDLSSDNCFVPTNLNSFNNVGEENSEANFPLYFDSSSNYDFIPTEIGSSNNVDNKKFEVPPSQHFNSISGFQEKPTSLISLLNNVGVFNSPGNSSSNLTTLNKPEILMVI